jgi:sugar phosphate isomerase/epimerase
MAHQNNLKLAVYLDQAAEDPHKAIKVISEAGIKHAVLRRAWSKNITDAGDDICASIKASLLEHDMKPILLCTDLGYCPSDQLLRLEQDAIDAVNLCQYYGCRHIRFGIGQKSTDQRAHIVQEAWMKLIDRICMEANIAPCLEISYKFVVSKPAEIASILHKYKRLRIIYDPAILVQTKKIDPYTRYWSLVKNRVSHIDVRDHKTGHAPVLAGQGDAKLDLTLSDASLSDYDGWCCLEPGLGRKIGDVSGLDNVFNLALSAYKQLLNRLDLGAR